MTERDDIALLREFAATESEAAFAALVQRHINLVYSTALRCVRNAHAAQEITQAVFIVLTKKARDLPPKIILSGWLYQTTRLTAANFLRGEIRRQQREQEAYMQSNWNEPDADVWPQIAPLLDDALAKLGVQDRNAIVLRFFENKNLREVGVALGASEDAAKMRVNRALEKLRKIFTKRGVTLSAAIIAGAVSANSVQAAPAGLMVTITAAAAKGAVVTASIATIVNGALKALAWAKAKLFFHIGAAALLVTGTVMVLEKPSHSNIPSGQIQPFEAFGICCYTNYSINGAANVVINSTFHVGVSESGVYMRLDYAPDYYGEWTYDGTNSFDLIDSPDRVNLVNGMRAAVTVNEDEFPTTAVCLLRNIWLGLASEHYFNNPTNQPALVPWGGWGLDGMLSYQWKIKRFADPPYFPKQIMFVASEALWEKEHQIRVDKRGLAFPFREGFVGGKFEVADTQTFNGRTYPTRFTLERYRVGRNEGKLLEYYYVLVTNISPFTLASFRPKITRPTDVSDMRSQSAEMPRFGITYTLTNDDWLEKSDPRRLAMLKAKEPIYKAWRKAIARKNWARRCLFYAKSAGLWVVVSIAILLVCKLCLKCFAGRASCLK